jgi:two-component system response regulator HydG
VYELIERMTGSPVTVLVTGESGTGKELVARALHRGGPRRHGPFVAVNCAALPEPLLESELFGHARGAFTDARSARTGLLVGADRGTLLLDEIGEMPQGMQVKLLRALQERLVRPVGAGEEIAFDARIVAATNSDLGAAVEAGTFREDLYYRLNVVQIDLPPLRARGNDVLLLAQHFLERARVRAGKDVRGLSSDAARRLLAYRFPGNVRELQNCMERAVALARYDEIMPEDLPERIVHSRPTPVELPSAEDPADLPPLAEIERRYILGVLEAVGGQRLRAAQILGIDRKTLYRKLETYRDVPPGD